ncbi:MAG: transcriptional regulator [Gammaproteobacteria bacterium]|nr:transcriptional regulator [Gammaproteobacteria bacterium]|tara:strand:+ start:2415 stop:3200 length:786 start_codon:yes stop_codon:yes gene_type:complete
MPATGHVLTEIRRARRLSQLDLGLQADVSARHISFIETGRAQPSRDMLLRLSEVMGLSHRDSNRLMNAFGYAAVFSDMSLDDSAMQPVREALQIMLDKHDPYPAAVLDFEWNLLMSNTAMQNLMLALMPAERLQQSANMLEHIFHPDSLRPYLTNWETVASLLLRRLRLQLNTHPTAGLAKLMTTLLSMDPPQDWQTPSPDSWEGPMLTSELDIRGQQLRVFSTLSSFGTALDAGLQELMIESYFPADEETRRFFERATGL